MSRDSSTSLALPVLSAGVLGGVAASLFCFCWVASLPAGAFAVRWAARLRGGTLGGGAVVSIGAATGLLLGGVTATLGTALFLASLDPGSMAEAAEMAEAMLGESSDMSRAGLAVGHGMAAFVVNFMLGIFGALLGAASLPSQPAAASPGSGPSAGPEPSTFRFEPPAGWTPEPPSVSSLEASPAEASPPDAEPALDAPAEPETPRERVPPEAFSSAWHSTAVGGTPLQAVKQSPPPDSADGDEEEPEEPTLDSGVPPAERPPDEN